MRILLIEDDAVLGAAVRDQIAGDGHSVDWVQRLDAADTAIAGVPYDLVLLDLMLPDGRGLPFLRRLRARGEATPVIILTALDQVSDRIEGLNAGADDYLVKPFDLHELAARLHALLRRAAGRSVDWIELGEVRINPAAGHIQRQGRTVELSRREWSLLRALLQSPGRILSTEQLRDSLYGYSQDVESNAVNVHVHHLRRKLGHELVETVRGEGYRLGLHP